jgi:hypothetical protein
MRDWTNYANAWNYKDSPDFSSGFKGAEAAFNNSPLPGVKIMKELKKILKPSDSEAVKVECLFKTFVEYAQGEAHWKWLGATPCGTPKVLDDANAQVECQGFVVALRSLMFYPAPFGLGIKQDICTVKTVAPKLGSEKSGFVACHPANGVMGLRPNIETPAKIDESLFAGGFYLWANHKVLEYGGRIYDPSYGRVYETLGQMEALSIIDYKIEGKDKPSTLQQWENEADNDNTGNYYYVCKTTGNGKTYSVKFHKNSDRARGFQYHGPYPA